MKPTKSFGESFFLVLLFCVCIGKGELVSFQRGCRTEWQISGSEGCWEDGDQGEGCVESCEEDRCNVGTLGYGTWERKPLFQIAGSEGEAVAKNKAATGSSPPQLSSIISMVIMMMYSHYYL
uniref:Uncharacterized protein n=1 Tax=Branchiostoma floridae TaxID=7739 RepID=C3YEW1_BRAFL|eukprot:XP_002605195.1 hypothetical protein BRAFLDRAFT_80863 [Branchiostoma floridae]